MAYFQVQVELVSPNNLSCLPPDCNIPNCDFWAYILHPEHWWHMLFMIKLHFYPWNHTELQIFRKYETCSPDTWTVTHYFLLCCHGAFSCGHLINWESLSGNLKTGPSTNAFSIITSILCFSISWDFTWYKCDYLTGHFTPSIFFSI